MCFYYMWEEGFCGFGDRSMYDIKINSGSKFYNVKSILNKIELISFRFFGGGFVLNRLVQFNVIRHYVETNLFQYYS